MKPFLVLLCTRTTWFWVGNWLVLIGSPLVFDWFSLLLCCKKLVTRWCSPIKILEFNAQIYLF
jgi:hypothetical protein